MPLLITLSARLRRRRAEVDRIWREATRQQADEYTAAVGRILAQARRLG